jgi:hypothetical protein
MTGGGDRQRVPVVGLREDDTSLEEKSKTARQRRTKSVQVLGSTLIDAQQKHEPRTCLLAERCVPGI